ncbi:MAG: hypothetical protein KAS32_09430 [Candidatus Peribacteraceae bacterium]|nr:hypothetical protein [Candidatus Peribacteraceae bacterium]
METIVKIEWDKPEEQGWLCPENIEIALSVYCTNTKFKVTQVKMISKIAEVIKCGNKLYYDINPNTKMDVPSSFYERLESYFDAWVKEDSRETFYKYCLSKLKDK